MNIQENNFSPPVHKMASLGSSIQYQPSSQAPNNSLLGQLHQMNAMPPMPPIQSGEFTHKVRILVTLRKHYGSMEEYKKMMLVVPSTDKIYSLKRVIEREFLDLFPNEQPYVVAKLEDLNGFSLSNGSSIGDFIQNGQVIIAQPEPLGDPSISKMAGMEKLPALHGGSNPIELVTMLRNLQKNILSKLAINSDKTKLHSQTELREILEVVIPLGFTLVKEDVQNLALILARIIRTFDQARVFDRHPHLASLVTPLCQFWLTHRGFEDELYIIQSVIELLDILVYSEAVWKAVKNSPVMNQLVKIQQRQDVSAMTKTKVLKVIRHLSFASHQNLPLSEKLQDESPYKDAARDYVGPASGVLPQNSQLVPIYDLPEPIAPMRKGRDDSQLPSYEERVSRQRLTRSATAQDNLAIDPQIQNQISSGLLSDPSKLVDQFRMLEAHNPQPIQDYAWAQIRPILPRVISEILPASNEVAAAVLRVISKNDEIAALVLKLISEPIANRLANLQAIDLFIHFYQKEPKPIFISLIKALLTYQTRTVGQVFDVRSMLNLAKVNPSLQELALQRLADASLMQDLTDAGLKEKQISHFKQHLSTFIELLVGPHKKFTAEQATQVRIHALSILANIAMREKVRDDLIQKGGVAIFLAIVKKDFDSTFAYPLLSQATTGDQIQAARRFAAKGLLNLVSARRELRLEAVTALAGEIKQVYRGEMDEIVATYISNLVG